MRAARVCDGAVGRNVGYLVEVHELDGVRSFGVLGDLTEFNAHGFHPSFT